MDFLRPRAIPALIAALGAAAAHGGCETLDGTYRYDSPALVDGRPRYLSDLTMGPDRRKLMRAETNGGKQGWDSAQPRSRPKVTHLAVTGTLAAGAKGATIEFRDSKGASLATLGIGAGWSCKGSVLERGSERMAGLGENIRTERVQETLSRSGTDLVYAENVSIIEPAGRKPKRTEIRFPAK